MDIYVLHHTQIHVIRLSNCMVYGHSGAQMVTSQRDNEIPGEHFLKSSQKLQPSCLTNAVAGSKLLLKDYFVKR